MPVRKRKALLLSFLAAAAVIAAVITVYIGQLNRAVSESTGINIEELALHDIKSIEGLTDKAWQELEHVAERIRLYDCTTTEDVQNRLILERTSSNFDAVYLLDDKGNVYTDTLTLLDSAEQDFDALFSEYGNASFVVRYEESGVISEIRKATLMYGVPLEPFQVEGVTFVGVLGRTKISAVQDQLRIQSFDGRGYSSIIDPNGDYIVSPSSHQGLNNADNFYTRLEAGELPDRETIEEIKAKIENNERFRLNYRNEQGEQLHLVLQPVQQTHWYFITTVPHSVYMEQSSTYLTMNTIMLAVVAVILLALTLLLLSSKQAALQASAMAKARSEFLSNMSHEIRTPLNGIIGLNHLMTANMDDQEKLRGYLQKSSGTAQYLLALVNDILDTSKLEAGKFELESTPISLDNAVNEVYTMQRENMESRGITFRLEKELAEPWVIGDDIRLKQVLMNLLSNAAKFTPKGGTVVLRAAQNAAQSGSIETVFEVEDTGCGISQEFQDHIFESFSQERNKNLSSQKGTGLGLSISYLLMRQMGGTLTVKSEMGKGSSFIANLPAHITGPLRPESEAPETCRNTQTKPLRVLIAEDNELNAEILVEILEAESCSVAHAADGAEAVRLFAESAPGEYDVILMDVQMPKMNGYEAAQAIRRLPRSDAKAVPIFACTAGSFKEDRDRAFASGMNDFLARPIDISVMMQKLEKLRREKR